MGKTTKSRFKASTAIAGMMNEILPVLQAQGWMHHYVTVNSGNGQDVFKHGVLTRDIPNPIYEKLNHQSEDAIKDAVNFARKHNPSNSYKDNRILMKPSQEADFDSSTNTVAKCKPVSDVSVNTQNDPSAPNPHYTAIPLFDEYQEKSRKGGLRAKSPVNTQTQEPAQLLASDALKTDGGEIPYGREGRPLLNSAPVDIDAGVGKICGNLPVTSMGDIETIRRMRMGRESITIGIDTEFVCVGDERYILTWQFAFSDTDMGIIHEVVFYSLYGERISMETALAWIVEKYRLFDVPFVHQSKSGYRIRSTQRWPVPVKGVGGKSEIVYCDSYDDALTTCTDKRYLERLKASTTVMADGRKRYHRMADANDVGYINDYSRFNAFAIPVTLLFHCGIADLPGFGFSDVDTDDILKHVSSISGGVVSLECFFLYPTLLHKHWSFRPIRVDVRDSMNFAPEKTRSLDILGEAVGVPKIKLPAGYSKDNMLDFWRNCPVEFLEYAITDCIVTICYSSVLWGYNTAMPVTISSGAVRACVPILKEYFGCTDKDGMDDYNAKFRGLEIRNKGLVKKWKNGKSKISQYNELVPVDDAADTLIRYAKNAYKGGYNACLKVGWFEGMTYDYDLKNAYATSMAASFDPDWLNNEGCIYRPLATGSKLRLTDFTTPYDMLFGSFKFVFPDSVKYPCIPVTVGDSLIYPRKYLGTRESDGVYAAGPELYLALKLGATITIVNAVKGIPRVNTDGSMSHAFRSVAKKFVRDRDIAKRVFGEKSLADTLLKLAFNCIYGKAAQGILEKNSWNAFTEQMEQVGGSDITSPVHASVVTSGVRACLLAAINQLTDMGYRVYSATTDGLISDAPFDVVQRLDLHGFASVFMRTRMDLTGDPSMWQMKHAQTSLLNFTTRGNVGLNDNNHPVVVDGTPYVGVNAHNNYKTGEIVDSAADRLALVKTVLSRTGRCLCSDRRFTTFREVARRVDRKDFYVDEVESHISMDFDLKRKPVQSSFETMYPVVDGVRYEIANFSTIPYETIEEYMRYKNIGINQARNGCLCTRRDWERFYLKLDGRGVDDTSKRVNRRKTQHVSDVEWSRIMTVVRGHREKKWCIPFLDDKQKSVKEKLLYINSFNKSARIFKEDNWKDCRKPGRTSQMLPLHMVSGLLSDMGAVFLDADVVDSA